MLPRPMLLIALLLLGTACSSTSDTIRCETVMDCPQGFYCDDSSKTCLRGYATFDVIEPDGDTDAGPDTGPDGDTDGGIDAGPLPDGSVVEPDGSVSFCSFVPPPGEFTPVRECRWNTPTTFPLSDDVVMTPLVANLTDDNGDGIVDTRDIPDIAFVSYDRNVGCCNVPGTLRVVSGQCGADGHLVEHFSVNSPVLDNSAGIAIGDLDGDGVPDIVAMTQTSGTVAFDNQGNVKWTSPHPSGEDIITSAQPSIDDLDFDGIAEVIIGRIVLDGATGDLKWRGLHGVGNNAFLGPMSLAADIDLDGRKEVIAGNTVYRADGKHMWTFTYPMATSPCQSGTKPCDGYSAVANFDDDPYAEIVIVRSGDLWILEHTGEELVHIPIPWDNCAYNEGGPPTVADFDGDGHPEIGVAGADFYVVFDLDCCDALPGCLAVPAGATECEGPGIRWSVPNNDCSSRVTGSSVFDFDGDGSAEVVYNDETYFRIFSGVDGTILFEEPNTSHTRLEYPIIADVDNDGNAEIVFIENTANTASPDHGIEVWGDSSDRWVPTRRIWNQHMYNITNINEDGTLPSKFVTPNWLKYNNFRQNMPDYNVFAAPDLQVEILGYDKSACNASVDILTEVCNQGDLRVGQGAAVGYWDLESDALITCDATVSTTMTLEPGDCEVLTCTLSNPPLAPARLNITACVDNELPGCVSGGANNECIEDNNSFTLDEEGCSGPIG